MALTSADYGLAEANLIRLIKHIGVDRGQGVLSPDAAAHQIQVAELELEFVRNQNVPDLAVRINRYPNKCFTFRKSGGKLGKKCGSSLSSQQVAASETSSQAPVGSTQQLMARYSVSHRVLKLEPFTTQTDWIEYFRKRECLEVYVDAEGQSSRRLLWFAKEIRRLLRQFPWLDTPVVLGQVGAMEKTHDAFTAECHGAQIAITFKSFRLYCEQQERAEKLQLESAPKNFRFLPKDKTR